MHNDLKTRILRTLPAGQAIACAACGLAWGVLSLYFQEPVVETLRYWTIYWNGCRKPLCH